MYGDQAIDSNAMQPMMVDENGMPLGTPPPQEPPQQQSMVRPDGTGEPNQQELDQAFPPQPQRQPPRQPTPRQPQQPQDSTPPADPLQPRP